MHALAELSPLGSYMVRVSFKNTIVGLWTYPLNSISTVYSKTRSQNNEYDNVPFRYYMSSVSLTLVYLKIS
jgi:hypothetical protein